jgi:serine/threonine protein kinase
MVTKEDCDNYNKRIVFLKEEIKKWDVCPNIDLKETDKLGEGKFGTAYLITSKDRLLSFFPIDPPVVVKRSDDNKTDVIFKKCTTGNYLSLNTTLRSIENEERNHRKMNEIQQFFPKSLMRYYGTYNCKGQEYKEEDPKFKRYTILEYIKGISLRKYLMGNISQDHRVSIMIQLISLLVHMNLQGVYHNDLTFDNIMIREDLDYFSTHLILDGSKIKYKTTKLVPIVVLIDYGELVIMDRDEHLPLEIRRLIQNLDESKKFNDLKYTYQEIQAKIKDNIFMKGDVTSKHPRNFKEYHDNNNIPYDIQLNAIVDFFIECSKIVDDLNVTVNFKVSPSLVRSQSLQASIPSSWNRSQSVQISKGSQSVDPKVSKKRNRDSRLFEDKKSVKKLRFIDNNTKESPTLSDLPSNVLFGDQSTITMMDSDDETVKERPRFSDLPSNVLFGDQSTITMLDSDNFAKERPTLGDLPSNALFGDKSVITMIDDTTKGGSCKERVKNRFLSIFNKDPSLKKSFIDGFKAIKNKNSVKIYKIKQ